LFSNHPENRQTGPNVSPLLNGPVVAEIENSSRLTVKPIPLTFLPYSPLPKDEIYGRFRGIY
jgi:hypothetical protein